MFYCFQSHNLKSFFISTKGIKLAPSGNLSEIWYFLIALFFQFPTLAGDYSGFVN